MSAGVHPPTKIKKYINKKPRLSKFNFLNLFKKCHLGSGYRICIKSVFILPICIYRINNTYKKYKKYKIRIDKKFETLVYKYVKIRNPDLGRNPRFLIHGGGVYLKSSVFTRVVQG